MHRKWTLLALAVLSPMLAGAQVIRGSVRNRADSAAVPGVVVLLIDSTGVVAARALSGDGGQFRIAAPLAGTYRVQTQRIGFRPDTTVVRLAAGQEREQVLLLGGVSVRMDTIRVVDERVCRGSDAPESVAAQVWSQARTALIAAQLTARSRSVEAAAILFDRMLDPNSERILEQSFRVAAGFTNAAWGSLSPDALHASGYVIERADRSVVYHAPGLDALLSGHFVADHCFRLTRSRDTTLVGIAFEPHANRRETPEVNGTLWLARQSAELRRLEFRYSNVPDDWSDRAGGDMDFARLRDGGWIISRWTIRIPIREEGRRRGNEATVRVAAISVVGGELSFVRRGRDTLFARRPLTLTGSVHDSVSGQPVVGARLAVAGTALTGLTDDRGAFAMPDLLPGEYTLEVRGPGYDAVQAKVTFPLLFAEGSRPPRVLIPSAGEIASARSATFTGRVIADTTNAPIAGATVAFPKLGLVALTNDTGVFRIAGVPPGTHAVEVRRIGFGPLVSEVAFPARETVERRVVLTRVAVLDTVAVVADSPIEEFETNRRLGLGKFLTRAEMEKLRGRHLSNVLAEFRDAGIIRGSGPHTFLTSKRSPGSFLIEQGFNIVARREDITDKIGWMRANGYIPPSVWCPESDDPMAMSQGMKCGCYARVYLDRMLLNPGEPTPPFDLSSMAPEMLEGLEFYSNPAQTPARYQGRNEGCGVLVLHRRRS